MSPSATVNSRNHWFVIWTGLSSAPLIYGFLASRIPAAVPPSPSLDLLRGVLIATAAVAAAVGILVMSRASRVNGSLVPPEQFQLRSVTAMAMFEAIAVFGFVLSFQGAPPSQIWLWSGASLVLMVSVALPTGLGYWSAREQALESGTTGLP